MHVLGAACHSGKQGRGIFGGRHRDIHIHTIGDKDFLRSSFLDGRVHGQHPPPGIGCGGIGYGLCGALRRGFFHDRFRCAALSFCLRRFGQVGFVRDGDNTAV